jgi:hypothetical protein
MPVNLLPRILVIAAGIAAAVLIFRPTNPPAPGALGRTCTMLGTRTTCWAPGNVEIRTTSAPVVDFPQLVPARRWAAHVGLPVVDARRYTDSAVRKPGHENCEFLSTPTSTGAAPTGP